MLAVVGEPWLTPHDNLVCVAVSEDSTLYAVKIVEIGIGGNVIYRIKRDSEVVA